jgi:hypothetical protein
MYNSNDLTFEAANANVCQSCGKIAIANEDAIGGKKSGIGYALLGWMFSFVSLLFVPILFGTLAFALGLFTYFGRSKSHGIALMIFASICFVFGSLLSFFVSGTFFL